jgi:hypothetical protein
MIKLRILGEEEGLRVAQEGFFRMSPESYVRRVPRIFRFQQVLAVSQLGGPLEPPVIFGARSKPNLDV